MADTDLGEVRAALEAAARLPIEVQSQTGQLRRLGSGSPGSEDEDGIYEDQMM